MKIPIGYHQRLSGSMVATHDPIEDPLFCDLCGRIASHLTGYEREYPKYPDIFVCYTCELETAIAKANEGKLSPAKQAAAKPL